MAWWCSGSTLDLLVEVSGSTPGLAIYHASIATRGNDLNTALVDYFALSVADIASQFHFFVTDSFRTGSGEMQALCCICTHTCIHCRQSEVVTCIKADESTSLSEHIKCNGQRH